MARVSLKQADRIRYTRDAHQAVLTFYATLKAEHSRVSGQTYTFSTLILLLCRYAL